MSGRVFYGVAQSQCKNRTRETQESVTSTDTVEEGSEQLLGRLLVSVPAPRRKGGRERSAKEGPWTGFPGSLCFSETRPPIEGGSSVK